MATQAELVARLTAAIDNRNVSPPVDGDAAAPDEGQAEIILERLVRTYNASLGTPPASPASSYSARLERWQLNMEQAFLAFDRSVRALMVMIIARAARDPFDVIIDPIIAVMDPNTPIAELASGVGAVGYMHTLLRYLPDIDPPVRDAALACAREYETFSRSPEPVRPPARPARASGDAADYPRAKRAAEDYVEYLDAIATPGGLP